MGLFDFLKKEEKKPSHENLPLVLRTENVNEALLKISASNNIAISSLDFDILDFKTYIKMENSDFVEVDKQSEEFIHSEEFLINEKNEIKQVYEIKIYKYEESEDIDLIGEMQINKYITEAKFIIKPESLLVYSQDLISKLKYELNKKKLKNSLLINFCDSKINKDLESIAAKIRVLGSLEHNEEIELCRCIDPIENIEGKIIYHYLLKQKNIKQQLIYPVQKDDVLIEIIKPKHGRNGRDCRGKIIVVPPVKEFTVPSISFDPNTIEMKEDEAKILYTAKQNGYVYKESDTYSIKEEMEISQINIKTGDVSGAEDSDIKLEIKESDALKEAIADNMTVETTVLIVRGNVGKSAKIIAKNLTIEGQTHQKATIYADKAFINVHKGYVEGKDIEINRLEGGTVKANKVKINQAVGGKVIAQEAELDIVGSHLEVYALKCIKIQNLKGNENKFIISPLEVLGINADVDKLEKKIEEVKRNINIKTDEYNKRKKVLLKNRDSIENLKEIYIENKKKSLKSSPSIIRKIKEYKEYKNKTLELKNEILLLQKDLKELQETLENFQTAIFNAKIISFSPWKEYNRIEFDMVEPPIKLSYDTKGSEGVCGFKLKDYGDMFKIVKIKVKKDDSSS